MDLARESTSPEQVRPLTCVQEEDRDGAKRDGARGTLASAALVSLRLERSYFVALALLVPSVELAISYHTKYIYVCGTDGQMRVGITPRRFITTRPACSPSQYYHLLGWPPLPAYSSEGYFHLLHIPSLFILPSPLLQNPSTSLGPPFPTPSSCCLRRAPSPFRFSVSPLTYTRMLTINKPVQYGYRSVHDLPTPPSTSRPSPPLIYQDSGQHKTPFAYPPAGSPSIQPMSTSHRSLPPPVAMTSVQPPPGSGTSQPPPVGQAPPPPPPSQLHSYGQLPPAPSWQHEESMRTWLVAKTEEEKRKQEEEKTRQESYRLEQRRMEHDILRTSLQGGIPPPMVPVVFAGMGGGVLPQAALDWMQQYFSQSQQPQQHPPALMPPGPISPEHQRRDSQAQTHPHYSGGGVPSTPGSAQGPPYASGYPGSPTRPRGQSMPGPMVGRPPQGSTSNLPALNTNVLPGQAGPPTGTSHPGLSQQQQQQEAQPSPSIYFHHWQPPTSQGGGGRGATDQPGTPSGSSKTKSRS